MSRSFPFIFLLVLSFNLKAQHPWSEVNFEDNNGAKWKISEVMRPHIIDSEELILNSQPKRLSQTKKLFKKLWKYSNRIAKTCFAEGDGHDYFHAWYVPYYKHLEDLRDELFYEDALTIIGELKTGFEIYHVYFE